MQKKIINMLLEISLYILFIVIIIIAKELFNMQNYKDMLNLVPIATFNIVICIPIGMYINSINRNMSFKNFKVDTSRLLIFIGCLILIILLWVFYGYLPKMITKHFNIVQYLISICAGSNLLSALFDFNSEV